MPTDVPKRKLRQREESDIAWPLVVASVPAGLIALVALVPGPLVLPAFAMLAVLAASLVYLQSCGKKRAARVAVRQRARDMAGMLMLVGFGAAMMTDAPGALAALAEVEALLGGRPTTG